MKHQASEMEALPDSIALNIDDYTVAEIAALEDELRRLLERCNAICSGLAANLGSTRLLGWRVQQSLVSQSSLFE